jgi:opacity protein-like surface antigen
MQRLLNVLILGGCLVCAGYSANAQDLGVFADINGGAAFVSGSPDTTKGGGTFTGTVSNVKFDNAFVVGGRVGYRFSDPLAVFVSYDYIGSDVSWKTSFPGYSPTYFRGDANSNLVLANVSYGYNVTDMTRVTASAGAGVAINKLSGVDEYFSQGSATPGTHIDDGTNTSFAGRAGLELQHSLSQSVSLNLGAQISYLGKYKSGDTRTFVSDGTSQPIGQYELNSTWATTITAGIRVKF